MLDSIVKIPPKKLFQNPLLFIHGAFHGSWCWDVFFLDYFVLHGYEVHAIDLRGHGKSGRYKNINGLTITDYIRDIDDYIKTLREQPIIIGHSMGGFITKKYIEDGELPAAILLNAPPPSGIGASLFRLFLRKPCLCIVSILSVNIFTLINKPSSFKDLFLSSDINDLTVSLFWRKTQNESILAFIGMLAARTGKTDSLTPTLVVGSENDKIFTVRETQSTAGFYGVSPVIIKDIAHDVMLDTNWKTAADTIIAWLSSIQ